MILTAHQPVYLPWLGLFHKIALADLFVSFNQVQYLPKDWNNRNKVKTNNGPVWLTVPVLKKGYLEKTISEIEINNSIPWRRKHWKTIETHYRKTAYFDQYAGFFESVYSREWQTLVELNEYMLQWFLDVLGIGAPVVSAGDYDFKGEKSALVLDMCRHFRADIYIFGIQGKNYADVGAFEREHIRPVFQEYHHPVYPQHYGAFESHLSVLDLIFNCGDKSKDIIMSHNLSKEMLAGRFSGAHDL